MLLFLKIFYVFTKIGTFNFGGGYAMLSLIHNEVVVKNQWLTNAEFTDSPHRVLSVSMPPLMPATPPCFTKAIPNGLPC
mgnify:CR=1 FL=1